MKKKIGLWIDHREAVIIVLSDKEEQIIHVKSNVEKQIRYAGGSRKDGLQTTEAIRGKRLDSQLGNYFDDIIDHIRNADTLQIFGPGEAKVELEQRIKHEGLKARIRIIETTDKMTDRQIAAKVREHLPS